MTDWTSIRVSEATRDKLVEQYPNASSHEERLKLALGDAPDYATVERVQRLEDRVNNLESRTRR